MPDFSAAVQIPPFCLHLSIDPSQQPLAHTQHVHTYGRAGIQHRARTNFRPFSIGRRRVRGDTICFSRYRQQPAPLIGERIDLGPVAPARTCERSRITGNRIKVSPGLNETNLFGIAGGQPNAPYEDRLINAFISYIGRCINRPSAKIIHVSSHRRRERTRAENRAMTVIGRAACQPSTVVPISAPAVSGY